MHLRTNPQTSEDKQNHLSHFLLNNDGKIRELGLIFIINLPLYRLSFPHFLPPAVISSVPHLHTVYLLYFLTRPPVHPHSCSSSFPSGRFCSFIRLWLSAGCFNKSTNELGILKNRNNE